ncbi:MAG: leucine-rich repeat domain-containing protein, partial [Butyrivibrio sp.]|nr:leucine-rich repeat domain-containing protein [Butyrivibrio sp.]
MKKRNRKILQRVMAALLSALLVMGTAQTASASETRDNINPGDAQPYDEEEEEYLIAFGNDWELNEFGKLTIKSDAGVEALKNDGNFYHYSRVKSVELQDGVTSIAEMMFIAFENMTDITIPSSVTSIGEEAFEYCRSLKEITIPSGVTSMGAYMFDGCES